MITRRI